YRANPPHPRLHQTRPHLPRTTRARSSAPRLTHHVGRATDFVARRVGSNRGQAQTAGKVGTAHFADEVRVAAHHELVTGAGQCDVETFRGALEGRLLVDDEHDRAALETLEAEDVAVEHLLGVPE